MTNANGVDAARFPIEGWRKEVANGDTQLGYTEWAAALTEQTLMQGLALETDLLTDVRWSDMWTYMVKHPLATEAVVAKETNTPLYIVKHAFARIGTPREVFEREAEASTRDRQVGGSHYKDMAVQPWAAMEAWMTPEELRGYHKGVIIAYLAREGDKGGNDDIAKAGHHLDHLNQLIKEGKA